MPKYNKTLRQRIANAAKMHEARRGRTKYSSSTEDYSNVPSDQPQTSDIDDRMRDSPSDGQLVTGVSNIQVMDVSNDDLQEDMTKEAVETIEDISYEISHENEVRVNEKIIRRRIIDVTHFMSELKRISDHGPLGCGFKELVCVAETQIGLQSKFTFKCQLCNQRFVINGDNCSENYLNINTCAVAGTIAIGGGQSQLNELLSSINLPVLSAKIYSENHDLVSNNWERVLLESMKKAAEKERHIAISNGRVNKDGIPIIDVVADGCWSKRSYKKNYNALSGAAAIIGKNTGEILFLGIKNKYCFTCSRAKNDNGNVAKHKCFKNYSGPSTNMESEIILEGFKESIKMHNLIYGRLISDGDSSTYSKIIQARPYPDVTVEKIECRNHILRNLCNKLQALATDTKYNIKHRKLITKKAILVIRSTICKAIKKHKNSDIQLLFQDIMISHLHGFGDHTKCRSYFCNNIGKLELPKDFFLSPLWQKICFIIQNVAGHARSLSYDVDSNVVELYNSLVAKLVGGKRVNFSLKDSYQTRCKAAAVSFNEKKSISRLYKCINKGNSPQGKIKQLETFRINKNLKNKLKRKPKKRTMFQDKAKEDSNYGQNCTKPDIPIDVFNQLKDNFIETLKKTDEERREIERKTVLQSECSEWLELRRSLLTASNFGKVILRKSDTSCHNFVRDLLYKTNLDHVSSIKHGRDNEKLAMKQLERQENIKIEPCGLFIDQELPFLGATPDGVCDNDTIVEIKCPITAHKMGIEEAIKKRKVTFWKTTKTGLDINKHHQWYYQVQGQLHITQRARCLLAVWENENSPLKIEYIDKDDKFWAEKMQEKLTSFYLDCVLPELVDPRHPRGMNIRNPSYIEDAIKKKKISKKQSNDTEKSNEQQIEKMPSPDRMQSDRLCDMQMPTCSRYLDFTNL